VAIPTLYLAFDCLKLVRWWPTIVLAASKAKPAQGFFVSVNGKVEAAKPSA